MSDVRPLVYKGCWSLDYELLLEQRAGVEKAHRESIAICHVSRELIERSRAALERSYKLLRTQESMDGA